MSINIVLPSINGEVEAGITIGVDASLPDDKKLPILISAGKIAAHNLVKQNAALWAYKQFNDATARQLFTNGVMALIDTGCICTVGGVVDGDYYYTQVTTAPTQVDKEAIEALVNRETMAKALTVVIATKVNFWLMNHHTGQDQVAGYVKKVLKVFYPNAVSDQLVSAAHNLGHFCSTLYILGIAGIKHIRKTVSILKTEDSKIILSAETKLRFSAMPAGTDRIAIAYEAAKRLVRSVYAAYCPGVEDFSIIPETRDKILEAPAKYHIGTSYLTGEARADYQDTNANAYLGRLGTFITTLYKQSTLAKSPHLTGPRIESYDDYDADFKALLERIQIAQAAARGRIMEEQIQQFLTAPDKTIAQVRAAFGVRR